LSAPLFTGRFSRPVLNGGNPICFFSDLSSWLLLWQAVTSPNLSDLNLPAPLFTARYSLQALKCRNPICLNYDLASALLPQSIGHLSKLKRPEFARTAFHWKIFSSSIEMRKSILL
jgi:hypothetical protein